MYKPKYFKGFELVSRDVYEKYGEESIKYLDPKILLFLDTLRNNLGKPIRVNNWKSGGSLSQRGLRENTSSIVRDRTKNNLVYLSAHVLGKGVDFDVSGMNINSVWKHILDNSDKYLKFITRLEDITATGPKGYIHADCIPTDKDTLHIFKP